MERVTLTIDMLSDNANHVGDGGGLPALIDGKVNTYYHTKWNAPVTTEAHYVQIKLNKPLKDLCFEYDARQSGVNNGGDVKAATIYGSMNGEFFESMGNEEFNLPTTNGGHATAKNNVSGKQGTTISDLLLRLAVTKIHWIILSQAAHGGICPKYTFTE